MPSAETVAFIASTNNRRVDAIKNSIERDQAASTDHALAQAALVLASSAVVQQRVMGELQRRALSAPDWMAWLLQRHRDVLSDSRLVSIVFAMHQVRAQTTRARDECDQVRLSNTMVVSTARIDQAVDDCRTQFYQLLDLTEPPEELPPNWFRRLLGIFRDAPPDLHYGTLRQASTEVVETQIDDMEDAQLQGVAAFLESRRTHHDLHAGLYAFWQGFELRDGEHPEETAVRYRGYMAQQVATFLHEHAERIYNTVLCHLMLTTMHDGGLF